MTLCIVRGAGDVGSAVAHALFHAGYPVMLHDAVAPGYHRRGMSYADTLFDGTSILAGLIGKRARDVNDLPQMLRCRRAIPVSSDAFDAVVDLLCPTVLVDARMRKRVVPEIQRGMAPMTIGLGPNFTAGGIVDVAVETAWGAQLGAVISQGATRPLAGEPRPIDGIGRERNVYAPIAGTLITIRQIGDVVCQGEAVATVGGQVLFAPISGRLRGLTRNGVEVTRGSKIIEIDPRGDSAHCFGIGERPSRIAEGVLAAVVARE